MPNRSFPPADQQKNKQEGINNGTNDRTITFSSRAFCPLNHLGKSKCPAFGNVLPSAISTWATLQNPRKIQMPTADSSVVCF